MGEFINEVVLDYDSKTIFEFFHKTAEVDFGKFDDKIAIGLFVEKQIGNYSLKEGTAKVEISDYIKDKIYEITTYIGQTIYKTRYELESIDENKTKLTLKENEVSDKFIGKLNSFVTSFLFKKRVRNRFNYMVKQLNQELVKYREECETN